LIGRRDSRIDHHGRMMFAEEVEAAMTQHSSVTQAVVALNDGILTAFLVAAAGTHALPDELKSFLRQRIPEPMVPSRFTFIEDVPLTADGHVDRNALISPVACARATDATGEYVAPRNDIERKLAQMWIEVFPDGPQLGIHDTFFSMGGHSLVATQLAARISDAFNLRLSLKELFETPTIAALAEVIQRQCSAHAEVQETKEKPQSTPMCSTSRP